MINLFCKQCGYNLKDVVSGKCPNCNTTIGKGGRFCPDCGEKILPGKQCSCCEPNKKEQEPKEERIFASKNSWTCKCGAVNTGKFCSNCGNPENTDNSETIQSNNQEQVAEPQKNDSGSTIPQYRNPVFAKLVGEKKNTDADNIIRDRAVKMVYGKSLDEIAADFDNKAAEKAVVKNDVLQKTNEDIEKKQEVTKKEKDKKEENSSKGVNTIIDTANKVIKKKETVKKEKENKVNESKKVQGPATELFPDVFSEENMDASLPKTGPINNETKKDNYNKKNNSKAVKNDNSLFYVCGLILTLLGGFSMLSDGDVKTWAPMFVAACISGLIDEIFSKKKRGFGIILASVLTIVLLLVLPNFI